MHTAMCDLIAFLPAVLDSLAALNFIRNKEVC